MNGRLPGVRGHKGRAGFVRVSRPAPALQPHTLRNMINPLDRHIFQIGAVAQHYDQIAPIYDHAFLDEVSQWERARLRQMLIDFAPRELALSTVYDLGCGTGLYLDLGLPAYEYYGFDISLEMIRRARRKHGNLSYARWEMKDISELRWWANAQTDYVISLNGALSKVTDTGISEIMRAFNPGVRFLIMLKAEGMGDTIVRWPDRRFPYQAPIPARHYSPAGIIRELDGLADDLSVHGFNFGLQSGQSLNWRTRISNAAGEALHPTQCRYLIVSGCVRGTTNSSNNFYPLTDFGLAS